TRARGSQDGDEIDLRIEQQVEREVLFAIACSDAPDVVPLAAIVAHELNDRAVTLDLAHDRFEAFRVRLMQKLVDVPIPKRGTLHAIERPALLLPGLDVLVGVLLPEVGWQLLHAGVQ